MYEEFYFHLQNLKEEDEILKNFSEELFNDSFRAFLEKENYIKNALNFINNKFSLNCSSFQVRFNNPKSNFDENYFFLILFKSFINKLITFNKIFN